MMYSNRHSPRYKEQIARLEQDVADLKSKNEELSNKLTEQSHHNDAVAEKEVITLKERYYLSPHSLFLSLSLSLSLSLRIGGLILSHCHSLVAWSPWFYIFIM